MDNLTHTLIGALVGEVAARVVPHRHSTLTENHRRNLCVAVGAIGSNLPDSDLLYSFFGGKVNYLLHHRGHTHTVVVALLLGAVMFAIMQWWLRRRQLQASRSDQWLLGGMLAFTPLLHIAMDATNNYGVHPFWPFDDRWFYGDSVFIIEPLFWAACAPLAFLFRSSPARAFIWLVLASAVGLVFFTGLVPVPIALGYAVIVLIMLILGWRASPSVALAAGMTLWLGTTLMFVITAAATRTHIDALAAQQFPESALVDRVVNPMPTNPWCWEVMLIQKEHSDVVLRRAMFALQPTVLAVDRCLTRSLDMPLTAPLVNVARENDRQVQWYGEIHSSLDELRNEYATNCEAAAAMRFIRAPWLAKIKDATVLGDLRYDREVALGFAEINIDAPPRCPPFVPRWTPPRNDLLTSSASP